MLALGDYREIEKGKARDRIRYILTAVREYPGNVNPILQDTDLLELLKMAKFADGRIRVQFFQDESWTN